MKMKTLIAVGIAATLGSGLVQAASISYTTSTIAPTPTDFTYDPDPALNTALLLDIRKFDSAAHPWLHLDSVTLNLTATVDGTVQIENRNATSKNITTNMSATATLLNPTGGVLVTTVPLSTTVTQLAKYDGTNDYAGTSGKTFTGSATTTNSVNYTDLATLALFSGTGFLPAYLSATGNVTASGASNISLSFSTLAGGFASVVYNYTPVAAPIPGAVWLFGTGIAGLLGFKRRGSVAAVGALKA